MDSVKLVEMGPRDGLQNEPALVPAAIKIELVERLADCGFAYIEAASFVSPRRIPQMADSSGVLTGIRRREGVVYSALTPNLQGLQAALAAGADEVAVFTAASERFCQRNINCSVAESLERFAPVLQLAHERGVRVRGYVSTVLGCPYEGNIAPAAVARVAGALYRLGCHEISLGDTIGTGTPRAAVAMLSAVRQEVPLVRLAAHFHDTYGQALANLYALLEQGLRIIDSSVAGLGGCPYAHGATGNVASEDVVYLLHGLGLETGVDLDRLVATGRWVSLQLGRENGSKTGRAWNG
ncbi:hydroxymethylglutaryl-CoA lyase [Oceanimonas baumannii]|uniref:hydroxymethylglutaryl-CoA lyase n=1 Tax=Oceanimonas baumannii TaxID=129578 RepID=A0A235CM06_9GAMM|nr:hydroxymethylglutaryl-CoA lyase [Oceanimonas baumannii]OYD25466.1 hydroxymethylglutaryl-CoA lyase [Oceanimonas baumannii]TDW61336.1 hydroxymethylglutaryl-CoA lyase [Oceanimonas baumannii]